MMASLFTFRNLYDAWLDCRRKKRSKPASLAFEVNAEEELLALTRELSDRIYRPSPSFCFVARNDKHREVFAAQFRDRVVHHLLVRRLERIWEPIFIHDSYACRKGKGTHAAVQRLQSFCRKVTANQTRRAWFLQLDIRAFFPSIDRQILLDQVLRRVHDEELRWLSEVLILHDPTETPVYTCAQRKWRRVPAHKSLFTVPEGKGLPIGNLTSQFFANVYLNELDQFAKHALKAHHYLRYVDDFVFLHENRCVLQEWRGRIAAFLASRLDLELRPNRKRIRPVSNGIDFAGYIVRGSHLLVRRRVLANCRTELQRHSRQMCRATSTGPAIVFPPEQCEQLNATLQSYLGILGHASSHGLVRDILAKWPFLDDLFRVRNGKAIPRWRMRRKPNDLYTQYRFFRKQFGGVILLQCGCYYELFDKDAAWSVRMLGMKRLEPRGGFYARCGVHVDRAARIVEQVSSQGARLLLVAQTGKWHGPLRERVGVLLR